MARDGKHAVSGANRAGGKIEYWGGDQQHLLMIGW
jgi:hypothetical protein